MLLVPHFCIFALNLLYNNFSYFQSSHSQSAAATPSSGSATRLSSTQAPTTPLTPAATSTDSPTLTPTTPASQTSSLAAGVGSPTQPIQLSDLQSILATMNVPAMSAEGQGGETGQNCLKHIAVLSATSLDKNQLLCIN